MYFESGVEMYSWSVSEKDLNLVKKASGKATKVYFLADLFACLTLTAVLLVMILDTLLMLLF